jgi:hypothetical protein
LLDDPVINLAGIRVGLLRLDHFHARHGDLLNPGGNVAEPVVRREPKPRTSPGGTPIPFAAVPRRDAEAIG